MRIQVMDFWAWVPALRIRVNPRIDSCSALHLGKLKSSIMKDLDEYLRHGVEFTAQHPEAYVHLFEDALLAFATSTSTTTL